MNTTTRQQLLIYRVAIIAALVALPAQQWTAFETPPDALVQALLLAFLALAALTLALSAASARARTSMDVLFLACAIPCFLVEAVRAVETGLAAPAVSGMQAFMICNAVMLHRQRTVIAWGVFVAVTLVIVDVLLRGTGTRDPLFLGTQLALLGLATLIAFSMINTQHKRVAAGVRLQSVFDKANEGLLFGRIRDARVEQMNERMCELLETSDNDTAARLLRKSLLAGYDVKGDPREFLRAQLAKRRFDDDLPIFTANGNQFFGRMTFARLADGTGQNMMVRVIDITDFHERERELERARDLARAAAETRRQFLANMSHEIRTPMNGVIGMTTLLEHTELSDEQAEFVGTIRASGESLLQIINDILDFSKFEAGQVELESAPFDLEQIVGDAVDTLAPLAVTRGIRLLVDMPVLRSVEVTGDAQRLRQVLVNLLSNAVKFTDHGQVLLRVRVPASPAGDGRDRLSFSIIDTGIGIAPDRVDHVFETFTQADASMTRRFGGTGLGLPISRSLVRLMGGDISVASRPGHGSTFRFDVAPDAIRTMPVTGLEDAGECRIAAVIEDAAERGLITGMLQHLGASVRVYPTVQALVDALPAPGDRFACELMPWLILLDQHMEAPGAATIARRIRERYEDALDLQPGIILLGSLEHRIDWRDFDQVVRKPVRPEGLRRILRAVLDGDDHSALVPAVHRGRAREVTRLEPEEILIVDDNTVNLMVARRQIERLGLTARCAENGASALAALAERPVRIVQMDLQMPELDGISATQIIRDRGGFQPWIIAMTANVMAQDRATCLDAGMNDFVGKPARLDDLAAVLHRAQQVLGGVDPPTGAAISDVG